MEKGNRNKYTCCVWNINLPLLIIAISAMVYNLYFPDFVTPQHQGNNSKPNDRQNTCLMIFLIHNVKCDFTYRKFINAYMI